MSAIIGLDVGGTTLKAVKIVDQQKLAAQITVTAGGHIPRDELARRIIRCVSDLSQNDAPEAVGLCFGGLLQPDGTMRAGSTNLSNLDQVPLTEYFHQLLRLPCRVENDAISAMRGEATLGAARGYRHAMTMTFGSGIGSGLLIDGHIHQGAHRRAGEIGVWRLAPCGSDDMWPSFEDLAAPGRFSRWHGSEMAELLQRGVQDNGARAPIESVFELVGRAIANAHLLLDLETVILTGGITALGEVFRKPIEAAYCAACPPEYRYGLEIKIGALGQYAGAVGAAALWFKDARS